MKRVGFLRLLQNIADGKGAYPLAHAVEDTVVDYHLEQVRRYISNPFTSAHFASARLLVKLLTRVTGAGGSRFSTRAQGVAAAARIP